MGLFGRDDEPQLNRNVSGFLLFEGNQQLLHVGC